MQQNRKRVSTKRSVNSPGRWVSVGGMQAFVPNPLPPDLGLSLQIIKDLATAERTLGELAGLDEVIKLELYAPMLIKLEAVASHLVEDGQGTGSYAANRPTPLIIQYENEPEVKNYIRALEHGWKRVTGKQGLIDLDLICELHRILFSGTAQDKIAGQLRTQQNYIGRRHDRIENAIYVPPPPAQMQRVLNELVNYINESDRYPDLIRLAFFHYQFEAIHPFMDGNGRVGRMLISLLLVHWRIIPKPVVNTSGYLLLHRQEYFDFMSQVTKRGDWDRWLQFFLECLTTQTQDTIRRARLLKALQDTWKKRLENTRSSGNTSEVEKQVLSQLFTSPTIIANDFIDRFTHRGTMMSLRKFVDLGILRKYKNPEKNKKQTFFIADDIYRIMENDLGT